MQQAHHCANFGHLQTEGSEAASVDNGACLDEEEVGTRTYQLGVGTYQLGVGTYQLGAGTYQLGLR
jgi:hypothetical protein